MIIIAKSQNIEQPFYVLTTGLNGEVLRSSETFVKKQKCWKNILADMHANYKGCKKAWVRDDTVAPSNPKHCLQYTLEEIEKKAGVKRDKV